MGKVYMEFIEELWEKILKIKTSGIDKTDSDSYRYPYEPTSYRVLETIKNSGYITHDSTVLDYGCGKGRVCFYLVHTCKCQVIGIDYNERMIEYAKANMKRYSRSTKVKLYRADASKYEVPSNVDTCYFFNPFSIEVFKKVFARIMDSYYACPRFIKLIFYYIQDEYLQYLLSIPEIRLLAEIPCKCSSEDDKDRERIHVFGLL